MLFKFSNWYTYVCIKCLVILKGAMMYQKNTLGIRLSDVLIFHSHPVIAHNLGGGELLYKSYITSDDGEKKKKNFKPWLIQVSIHIYIFLFLIQMENFFMVPINKVKFAASFTLENLETKLLWFMYSISPKRQFIFLASLFWSNLNSFPHLL